VEHDDLALDRVGVDGASVSSLVVPLNVADLQVPLLDVGPHDAKPEVINHSPVLVRERY